LAALPEHIKDHHALEGSNPNSLFILIDMSTFNSTETGVREEVALESVNGVRDLGFVYASVAIAVTMLLMSRSETGRKVLLRVLWFFDNMLGGAPHTVTLPGPPGLPIIGNLFEVSYTYECGRLHLTPSFS
jgi:hypothetical protein